MNKLAALTALSLVITLSGCGASRNLASAQLVASQQARAAAAAKEQPTQLYGSFFKGCIDSVQDQGNGLFTLKVHDIPSSASHGHFSIQVSTGSQSLNSHLDPASLVVGANFSAFVDYTLVILSTQTIVAQAKPYDASSVSILN